ncbi:hypothetical protein [Halonatronum saccharophilum]|uniref:hypothetical protein n=1 Tax=Halonatronum saccharophilum TaxID=150060 RepID=UPI0004821B51|nr:hypothetical protein [Halonatronum saccharophilum]
MKARWAVILTVIMVLVGSTNLYAGDRFGMGFNYFNSQQNLSGGLEGDLGLREVNGRVNLNKGFTLQGSYAFGDNRGYINSDLKNTDLSLIRNFIENDRSKLSLGAGVNQSLFSTDIFGQGLFDIQEQSVNLIGEVEHNLTRHIGLFANYKYGLLNDYNISSPNIEVGDLGNFRGDESYSLQAGLSFRVADDLRANIGYRKSQGSIQSTSFSSIPIEVNGTTLTDLTNINRSTEGLFFGVETRF